MLFLLFKKLSDKLSSLSLSLIFELNSYDGKWNDSNRLVVTIKKLSMMNKMESFVKLLFETFRVSFSGFCDL